jgi:hypothetical protein
MHTFQVGKHYLAFEDVPMFTASVFDHSIRDSFLVFASELGSATRTLLSELHSGEVYEGTASRLHERAECEHRSAVRARRRGATITLVLSVDHSF